MIVECHAGYEYPEYPQAVVEDGIRTEVSRIAAEWLAADGAKHFLVSLEDGRTLELTYDPHLGDWAVLETVKQ